MKTGVKRLRLLFFVSIAVPVFAHAQVVITEIMYDLPSSSDSGREWVEVYNASTVPVVLTGWKLYENGTNHKITAVSGSNTLAPGAYAVIADNAANFKTGWPEFSGQLFDSAFSLSNSGETIVLRNASSSDIDAVTYQSSWGASGDGNSLNRLPAQAGAPEHSDTFVARRPSPGAAMSPDAISPPPPKAAPLPKTKTTVAKIPSSSTADDSAPAQEIVGDIPPAPAPDAQAAGETAAVAAAAPGSSPSYMWWGAAVVLALAAGGSLVAARRFGKREWDIIEEKAE
jgi:hypothetical protein